MCAESSRNIVYLLFKLALKCFRSHGIHTRNLCARVLFPFSYFHSIFSLLSLCLSVPSPSSKCVGAVSDRIKRSHRFRITLFVLFNNNNHHHHHHHLPITIACSAIFVSITAARPIPGRRSLSASRAAVIAITITISRSRTISGFPAVALGLDAVQCVLQ